MELKISDKVNQYFEKVKKETNRKIRVIIVDNFLVAGMVAAFSPDPSFIKIGVLKNIINDSNNLENSLAHEVTHGLLLYGYGYSTLKPITQLNETQNKSLGLIGTMIDDIVVNKLIQDEGFEPYAKVYPSMVSKEATALNKGKNFYNMFDSDEVFKSRFITFRYVLAWGFNEYFNIDNNLRVDINKYFKAVKKQYEEISRTSQKITESIRVNNIFTADGHRKVYKEILDIWGLNESVEFVSFNSQ